MNSVHFPIETFSISPDGLVKTSLWCDVLVGHESVRVEIWTETHCLDSHIVMIPDPPVPPSDNRTHSETLRDIADELELPAWDGDW